VGPQRSAAAPPADALLSANRFRWKSGQSQLPAVSRFSKRAAPPRPDAEFLRNVQNCRQSPWVSRMAPPLAAWFDSNVQLLTCVPS
jgi:hypothetical protein